MEFSRIAAANFDRQGHENVVLAGEQRDPALNLVRSDGKAGVVHRQWPEDMVRHIGAERLATGGLDRKSDPVGTDTIKPVRPRFEHQRCRDAGDAGGNDPALRPRHIGAGKGIAEPRRMGEEMAQRDRLAGGLQDRLLVRIKAGQQIGPGQLRQHRINRFVERQQTAFDQLHGGDRGHRFCHRGNLEYGVERHRLSCCRISVTGCSTSQHRLGIADHRHRAGHRLLGQRLIQGCLQV